MPDWIAARLLDECGDGAEALATALNAEPPRTIRANLLRTPDRDALAEELRAAGVATEPTRFAPHGLVVDGTVALYELDAFREGRFEQQDEASQLCALVVAPPPRGRILDACAGGGGKALALAAELQNRGEILAVDAHDRRLAGLTPRRRRAGVDVIRSVHVARGAWPPTVAKFARRADRILIDAPCSGIGSWRRRTDARWSLDPDGCAAMRRTQSELLDRAIAHLRPGARVIYATCTVFRDENEDQIEAALARHPELETVRVAEILGRERALPITDPSGTFLRLRPELHGTDGFFAAVLRRPK
jgi:16S rRNA (cytosine967-C5)-methyltransferase